MNATKTRKPTKLENYRTAQDKGAGFLANVILTSHKDSARKLAGLVKLLDAGHDVRTTQFNLDILMIDGAQASWETLMGDKKSKADAGEKTFDVWMVAVDKACQALCGLSAYDLPDVSYRDWFEFDEETPKGAAKRAIRMAKDELD